MLLSQFLGSQTVINHSHGWCHHAQSCIETGFIEFFPQNLQMEEKKKNQTDKNMNV